jgi:hypothetical protein
MAITTVKVTLERLRQHLIDMNDVTLRSEVKSTVSSGARHGCDRHGPDRRGDPAIGLLVQGGHHQPHHLAMVKGEDPAGH